MTSTDRTFFSPESTLSLPVKNRNENEEANGVDIIHKRFLSDQFPQIAFHIVATYKLSELSPLINRNKTLISISISN